MKSVPASVAFPSAVLLAAALLTEVPAAPRAGKSMPQKPGAPKPAATAPATVPDLSFPTPPRVLPQQNCTFRTATTDDKGKAAMRRDAQVTCYLEQLGGGVKLEIIALPGGTFMMGSPEAEAERIPSEGPPRQVSVRPFLLGKFEVTQAQWRAVALLPKVSVDLSLEPAQYKGDDLPVAIVSWDDIQEFCARLSKATGRHYRLPTEAEWEYACRGGTTGAFAFGPNVTPDVVNYDGNVPYGSAPAGASRGVPVPVGSLGIANAFGLYDMHGNVWEWCADTWHDDYTGAPADSSAWEGGDVTRRVLRGGSYKIFASFCRSAARSGFHREFRQDFVGFRVACDGP